MNIRIKQYAQFFLTVFFMGQINTSLHFAFVPHVFSKQNLTSTHVPDSNSHHNNSKGHDDCQVLVMLTSASSNVHTMFFLPVFFVPLLICDDAGLEVVILYSEKLFIISPSQSPPSVA